MGGDSGGGGGGGGGWGVILVWVFEPVFNHITLSYEKYGHIHGWQKI